MDNLQRKKRIAYRQTRNNRANHESYQNRTFPTNNNRKCDWLLCLIFCLGFVIATLISILIFALIQYHSERDHNNESDPDANLGVSVIDHSMEVDTTKIDAFDIPQPLPPLQSTEIESNALYQSLRDDIDIIKLPINCSHIHKLYRCEGAYFRNLTHYHDDWSHLVGTEWHLPAHVSILYNGAMGKYRHWRYNIINYPIIPKYLSSRKPRDNIKITIVTQTSMDRLHLIEMIASNWKGVISVAIYIRLEESLLHSQELIIELFERIETKYDAILDISLLFELDYLYKREGDKGLFSVMYPVNHLRNIALQTASTELVLLTDGDFITNKGFHDKAVKQWELAMNEWNIMHRKYDNISSHIAVVIPAFEFGSSYKEYSNNKRHRLRKARAIQREEEQEAKEIDNISELPLTKEDIIKEYRLDKVRGFHIHRCTRCHTATNYSFWLGATGPYVVKYQASYEPYIMTKRIGLNRYDARFRGYGWNKIVHLLTLAWIDKAHWIVANDVFIFHIPHSTSRESATYFKGPNTARWKWIMGLSKLALRDLKRRKDQTGHIIA